MSALSPALRHWVEEALARRGPALEAAFPPCFDWDALCADAPRFVRLVDAAALDEDDLEGGALACAQARDVLRLAYVATLAILAAGVGRVDPDESLGGLESLSDEEEEAFEDLVADSFESLERALVGQGVPARRGREGRAWKLVEAAAPALDALVAEAGLPAAPVGAAAGRTVLWNLARIGLLLAVLRWLAREESL